MGKGKLVFKGDKPSKKKKKRKSKHKINPGEEGEEYVRDAGGTIAGTTDRSVLLRTEEHQQPQSKTNSKAQPTQQAMVQKGEGKITSSGTVLTGHSTIFSTSLRTGDAIIAMVPSSSEGGNRTEEMRVVTMSLSNTSAAVSTAFSRDLKTPTGFRYIAKPRNVRKEKMDREKEERVEREEKERSAFGIYNTGSGAAGNSTETTGGQELVYRERTEHGGYRIRREVIHGSEGVARTDLLDMRTKKKSDKYC